MTPRSATKLHVWAGRTEVSDSARSLGGMRAVDYEYACTLDPAPTAEPAERWARAVFEGAPAPLRLTIVAGWRVALWLRIAPRSPANILGWTIATNEQEATVLRVDSPLLTAHIVVQTHETRVVHTTLVRLERPLGRVIWALAAPIHQLVIPLLLKHAATRLAG
ncbi:MAG: DUF2867 domain-containing protein [Solirubrobacteraceae bacterium]